MSPVTNLGRHSVIRPGDLLLMTRLGDEAPVGWTIEGPRLFRRATPDDCLSSLGLHRSGRTQAFRGVSVTEAFDQERQPE